MTALVSGRPALVGDGCVGLGSPGGAETSALVLPHSTYPSNDGRAGVLPDGARITLGDSIPGSGSCTTIGEDPDAFALWPKAPPDAPPRTWPASPT